MNYQQTAKQKIRKVDSFYQLFPNIKKHSSGLERKDRFQDGFGGTPVIFDISRSR